MARFAVIPAKRSNAMEAARRYKIVVGLLMLAALLGPLGALISIARAPDPVDTTLLQPLGRGLAEVVARDYLAGRVPDVPHTKDFDPQVLAGSARNGFKPLVYDSIAWERFTRANFGASFEVNYFVVFPSPRALEGDQPLGGEPQRIIPLQVAVTTLLPPGGGALLAAAPTLNQWERGLIAAPLEGAYQGIDGRVDGTAFPEVESQVARWAQAYATDQRADLKTYTRYRALDKTFVGLGGFTAKNSEVISVIPASEYTLEDGSQQKLFVVRARVFLEGAQGSVNEGFQSEAAFDLLVTDPEKADPAILVWGPAGSAGILQPYTNAIATTSAPTS